jgi:hypothetical protein
LKGIKSDKMLGFKQKAILEEFKRLKKIQAVVIAEKFYPSIGSAMATIKTLELNGEIKFIGNGTWEYIGDKK